MWLAAWAAIHGVPEDPIQISTSPRVAADRGRRALALTPGDVFLIYFAMGGTEDQEAIYRFLNGDGRLSDAQFDVLAAALNDEFLDRGQDHPVPYSVDFGRR